MISEVISQGAEAIIFKERDRVVKNRIKKGYRLSQLDEKIRKSRTRKEVRLIRKASSIVPVPELISFSEDKSLIELEYINGKKISDCLDKLKNKIAICRKIGSQIAKLHDANIIHGDLTTSNMILSPNNSVYFIDFGLGFESSRIEDKAVDLHLIKEALEARHHRDFKKCFKAVMQGYKISKNYSLVLQRFKLVESRGRYKESY
ncbi:Kae1-associated serine/threonine protein kinase [Candidatus Pacearchaeota archaeon]|nr:Kae1-associated serine/threonine protein kinase [Candidatus Pacearchaeota archaeon]